MFLKITEQRPILINMRQGQNGTQAPETGVIRFVLTRWGARWYKLRI